VYNQYQGSLVSSQREYEERLKTHAKYLKDRYQELVHEFVASFSQYSENQMDRLEVKRIAEQFFETTEIAIGDAIEERTNPGQLRLLMSFGQ